MAGLLLRSTRPEQWTKNLIVFAGLLFGGRLLDAGALGSALAAFAVFCALSGAAYLFNDISDREADEHHPLKRHRPIAAGQLPVRVARCADDTLEVVHADPPPPLSFAPCQFGRAEPARVERWRRY